MLIKSPILFCFIFFIIFILIIDIVSFNPEDLNSPYMFKDEICSYNGLVNKTSSNHSSITCICKDDYYTFEKLTGNQSYTTINGVRKQCQYEKKRRFIALFLAIFVPFGIDHIYLGNYYLFVPILLLCCTAIIGNFVRFAFPSVDAKKGYLNDKINIFFAALILLSLAVWVLNIALIASGVTQDGNKIDTKDDIPNLSYY